MHVKNYRPANLLVCNQFISDPFPQKKTGLDRVGEVRGKVSRQSREAKVRAAEDQSDKPPGGLRTGGQRPSGPRAESQEHPKPSRERVSPLF